MKRLNTSIISVNLVSIVWVWLHVTDTATAPPETRQTHTCAMTPILHPGFIPCLSCLSGSSSHCPCAKQTFPTQACPPGPLPAPGRPPGSDRQGSLSPSRRSKQA
ncbi:hypothetical protein BKA60DRAFT_339155 [Fusarium oxysporum]|nr:hypothetical protein BKA60DRAFT_339155 [Fusarium oxysporum]